MLNLFFEGNIDDLLNHIDEDDSPLYRATEKLSGEGNE